MATALRWSICDPSMERRRIRPVHGSSVPFVRSPTPTGNSAPCASSTRSGGGHRPQTNGSHSSSTSRNPSDRDRQWNRNAGIEPNQDDTRRRPHRALRRYRQRILLLQLQDHAALSSSGGLSGRRMVLCRSAVLLAKRSGGRDLRQERLRWAMIISCGGLLAVRPYIPGSVGRRCRRFRKGSVCGGQLRPLALVNRARSAHHSPRPSYTSDALRGTRYEVVRRHMYRDSRTSGRYAGGLRPVRATSASVPASGRLGPLLLRRSRRRFANTNMGGAWADAHPSLQAVRSQMEAVLGLLQRLPTKSFGWRGAHPRR